MNELLQPDVLAGTLRIATPLLLAALGGLFCERAGVVNIALEGIMTNGAFAAVAGTWLAQHQLGLGPGSAFCAGLTAAMLAGLLTSLLHAWVSVTVRADQIISGLAINILAVGATRFGCSLMFGSESNSPMLESLRVARPVDLLPTGNAWVDGGLLSHNPLVYAGLVVLVASALLLYRTRFGLRLRAVGEHPGAADSLGISVVGTRYRAVLISGLLAGLAGAALAVEVQQFTVGMTGGRGYIALAALIFGKWRPYGVLGAVLLFGFAERATPILADQYQWNSQLATMVPYLVTLLALAGFVGRATPPAAIGKPYVP